MSTDAEALHRARSEFRDELVEAGVLQRSLVDGVYHRSRIFEQIVRAVESLAHRAGAGSSEPLAYLPPVMPREVFVKTDYLRSFPDLVGSIEIFAGSDSEHAELLQVADDGGDWAELLVPSEIMLCSAACHPIYPGLTGRLPEGGRFLEVQGFCFRHEPSIDPTRMQSFRQHEFVRVGSPQQAIDHRDTWLERAVDLLSGLGLPVEAVVANDPFFGRAGRILAMNQRETTLKYEVVCPVISEEAPTAITSTNYHMDHFGVPFDIRTSDGEIAHTACIGFGLERIALALLRTHGLDPARWPSRTRTLLWE